MSEMITKEQYTFISGIIAGFLIGVIVVIVIVNYQGVPECKEQVQEQCMVWDDIFKNVTNSSYSGSVFNSSGYSCFQNETGEDPSDLVMHFTCGGAP